MMNWLDYLGQGEAVRILLAVLAGVAVTLLVSLSRRLFGLRQLCQADIMNRLAPVLTILPGEPTSISGQGSLSVVVKNSGGGVAADLQAEAQWGERRWALLLPVAIAGHDSELLHLAPAAPDRKHKPTILEVHLRYTTVTGLVCAKSCYYLAAPGGGWFIVQSEEEVQAPRIRRIARRKDLIRAVEATSAEDD